jgi:hypothetical protein
MIVTPFFMAPAVFRLKFPNTCSLFDTHSGSPSLYLFRPPTYLGEDLMFLFFCFPNAFASIASSGCFYVIFVCRHLYSTNMPLVKNLWDPGMRLKLCIAVVKPMNFIPLQWGEICKQLVLSYSKHHCRYIGIPAILHLCQKLSWTRKELESMMKGPVTEPSTTTSASVSDKSSTLNSRQGETTEPNRESEHKAFDNRIDSTTAPHNPTTGSSHQAQTPTPTQMSNRATNSKKASANTAKNRRRPRVDDESEAGEDGRCSPRPRKQPKPSGAGNHFKSESVNDKCGSNLPVRTSNSAKSLVKTHRQADSYRPVYNSGQPDRPILQKSRPTTPSLNCP